MILNICCGPRAFDNYEEKKKKKNPVEGDVGIDIGISKTFKGHFIQADAHFLPFRNEAFDTVVCYEVIEHVDSPRKVLKEIARVLKKGGRAIISTPNPHYLPKILRLAFKGRYSVHPDHAACFGQAELLNLVRYAGLKGDVRFTTYRQAKSLPLWQRLAIKLCPFKPLKGRQLMAEVRK